MFLAAAVMIVLINLFNMHVFVLLIGYIFAFDVRRFRCLWEAGVTLAILYDVNKIASIFMSTCK